MNIARIFTVLVTIGVLSTASSQEPQRQDSPPAAKPAAGAPANGSQAPNGGGNAAQTPNAPSSGPAQPVQEPEKVPPPPSAAVRKTGVIKDNEFIPTEEIQPDEAVTFPVDI